MAITREKLRRAIENYLPSSLTVSLDPETNTVDPEKVFRKLQTLTAAALVTDPNSTFYLISLALSEAQDEIDAMSAALDLLSSQEVLLSAEQSDPSLVTSTADLSAAIRALSGLSSGSGDASFSAFDSSVSSFQTTQLSPLVKTRNLSLIDADISAQALVISTALAQMRTLVDRVEGGLSAITTADVKKLAASQVAASISVRLKQIQAEVEAADAYEQAEQAESILVDLLAAQAALRIVFKAAAATGTAIVPVSAGAKTRKTYLTLQGDGDLTPQQYVAKGASGRPLVDFIYGSRKGSVAPSQMTLTASVRSTEDLVFPVTITSGALTLTVNGESESVTISGTFYSADAIALQYNAASLNSTAAGDGDRVRIYAYKDDTSPVGGASVIEITGGDDTVLSGLRVEDRLRGQGSLRAPVLNEGSAVLSSYTFPTKTTALTGGGSRTEFLCYVASTSGEYHRIVSIDTTANTLTLSPGFLAQATTASDGSVSYGKTDINYVVLRSFPGTLFVSGDGASTSPTASDSDGTSLDTFLPLSAGSTGSTESSAVRNPMSRNQATATIQAQSVTSILAGSTLNLFGTLFEAEPLGSPAAPDRFAIGADEIETISNLNAAIQASPSNVLTFATVTINTGDASILNLQATASYPGTAGNALATPTVPAGFAVSAFSGGVDAGSTWSGDGVSGSLAAVVRITGADGTNQKEAGTATVAAAKWSGTAGIAYKGYGSRKTSEWYLDNDGTWGKKLAESTASAGTVPSPSNTAPTNVMAFTGHPASKWSTDDAVVYWDNSTAQDITAGMWFVMGAWDEVGSGTTISGPLTGVGGRTDPSDKGSTGVSGSSFFVSAVDSTHKIFTIKAPAIDVDGNGTGGELGETWHELGWSTTATASAVLSMEGYFFDPNRFLIATSGNGFTSAYTTETGYFIPQVGDTVFYEKQIGGVDYRANTTIASIASNLDATLTDPGGTNGANDFAFSRRTLQPSVASTPSHQTGVKYTLVRDTATAKLRFYVSSATTTTNLSSKGVASGDLLHISTGGQNSGWYIISSVSSDGELSISSTAPGYTAPDGTAFKQEFSFPQTVTWAIYAPDYQQRVTDDSEAFLTNGVAVGDTIVITSGGFAGNYNIAAVEGETSLLVTATTTANKAGPFTSSGTPTYIIPENDILGGVANNLFASSSSYFSGVVSEGDILTVGGSDYTVSAVSDSQTLQLTTNFSSPPYFTGQAFTIRKAKNSAGAETTPEFTVDLSANAGLSDLLNINGIAVGSQIDLDVSSGTNLKDGYLQITSGASQGTYSIVSVDAVSGSSQIITLGEELPLSAGGDIGALTWKVLAGKTTAVFTETGSVDAFSFTSSSSSDFATRPPTVGDTLVLSPGEDSEERIEILSVGSPTELTLKQEVTQGQTGMRYGILPAEYPQIGDDLVVGSFRSRIDDITIATSGGTNYGALRLSGSVPYSVGTATRFYVVPSGGNPRTTFIEDSSPDVGHDDGLSLTAGFNTPELGELVGRTIQLALGEQSVTTTILDVVDNSTLALARPIDAASGSFFYRVLTSAQGQSKQLSYPATLTESIQSTDQLTIWQADGSQSQLGKAFGTTEAGTSFTTISFTPEVESGLSSLDFVVTRGGGSGYGRYLLLLSKLTDLATRLDAYKFSDLNLRLGEVLSKHGADRVAVAASTALATTAATAPDDGDGDATTGRLDVSADSSHTLEGLLVGDRVAVTYTDDATGATETKVCWVTLEPTALSINSLSKYDALPSGLAAGTTLCVVQPEIPVTSSTYRITSWSVTRSSISFALYETLRLRLLLEATRDIVARYSVESSPRVDEALLLLREEGYDRMADLLISGQYTEFFGVSYDSSSYQEMMKKTVREVGSLLLELRNG